MADSNTTTYSFTLPEVGASADSWGTKLNANWDKVDDLLDGSIAVNGITVTGGSIDGTPVGATTPSTGEFTTVTTTGNVDVTGTVTADGLTVDGDASIITLNNTDTSLTIGQTLAKIDIKQNDPSDQGVGVVASIEVENKGSIQGLGQFNFKTGSATSLSTGLSITDSNDVHLYEDTGTTAKFVWDASAESLGIGITSPSAKLDIRESGASTDATINLVGTNSLSSASCISQIKSKESSAGSGSSELSFSTRRVGDAFGSPTEAMRIDSSGNVGIGTDSPGSSVAFSGGVKLQTADSTSTGYSASGSGRLPNGTQLSTYNTAASSSSLSGIGMLNNGPGGASMGSYIGSLAASSGWGANIVFGSTSGSSSHAEKARIDSSGNLLVGKTVVDGTSAGIELRPDSIRASRTSNPVAFFNRRTDDGEILRFQKDGTTVGSIQSRAGLVTTFILDPRSTGAGITGGGVYIYPTNNSGSLTDGVLSLGISANRFKDLYLSGFIYAGETDSSSLPPRMTMERHGDGGGGGIFSTAVAGKAQQGMLYAFDESNGNRLICALSKEDTGNGVITETIMSNGLWVVATNAGGTIQLSSTATTVKMFVTKYILD